MTKSMPQLCKDGFDIQDGSSHVVLPMRLSPVMMKFSGQIQLGKEIMSSIFCTVFSIWFRSFFLFFFCSSIKLGHVLL